MGKTIAIIVSAMMFALVGLGCSITGLMFGETVHGDEHFFLTFAPPIAGTAFGLVVGCVAVVFGLTLFTAAVLNQSLTHSSQHALLINTAPRMNGD